MDQSTWNPALELPKHRAFLCRLARRLVRDEACADDLVQETCLRTLRMEHGPAGDRRSFLAGVLRQVAREFTRSSSRRRTREKKAARGESRTDRAIVEFEAQESLMHALGRLDEVTRAILILRYQDGLSVATIAAMRGDSFPAVKSRIHRGLNKLRSELRADEGGESMAVLGVLAKSHTLRDAAASLVGALMMLKTTLAAAGCILAIVLAATLASPRAPELTAAGSPVQGPTRAALASPRTPLAAEGPGKSSTTPGPRQPAAATAQMSTSALQSRYGLVVDLTGTPVAGLTVESSGDRTLADSTGTFPLPAEPGNRSYRSAQAAYATVSEGIEGQSAGSTLQLGSGSLTVVEPDASQGNSAPLIVVAAAIDLAGQVISAQGEPVPHVALTWTRPESWSADVDLDLGVTKPLAYTGKSDSSGRFELRTIPAVPGAKLIARCLTDRRHLILPVPPFGDGDMRIVLPDDQPKEPIRGIVVDSHGEPVEGAFVALGDNGCKTDPDGGFVIDSNGVPWNAELRAVLPGAQPALLPSSARPGASAPTWNEPVRLVLGAPTLTLRGRVIDQAGSPVSDVIMSIRDETPFGRLPNGVPVTVEGLTPAKTAFESVTDEDGMFSVHGLSDREYTLGSRDWRLGRKLVQTGVRPGPEPVVLVLGPIPAKETWAGTVVNRRGRPVGGLKIAPVTEVNEVLGSQSVQTMAGATTDAEGRFTIAEVPETLGALLIDGPAPRELHELPVGSDRQELRLVVDELLRFQVELSQRFEHCDRFALRAAGEVLETKIPGTWQGSIRGPRRIDLGRSTVLVASERADELVLYSNWEVIHVEPIRLVPSAGEQVLRVN